VCNDRVEIVKTLIQAGADVNRKNRSGYQAIHLAAARKTEEAFAILQILLWAGCELEGKSEDGETALHIAESGRSANALIQGGADIESRIAAGWSSSRKGCTPLHVHACDGNLQIVMVLIQAGAEVNARCSRGETSL
jgi:ankyrin repeat protein